MNITDSTFIREKNHQHTTGSQKESLMSIRWIRKVVKNNFVYLKYCFVILFISTAQTAAQFDLIEEENEFYRKQGYILLAGEQSGDYESNMYLVTDDIIIKKGQTLTFYPGTVILFKKNTGITVNGTLICQGNLSGAVTLKKLDNEKYFYTLEPELPALWRGIEVLESAQIEMRHTTFMNSKSGIEAAATIKSAILESVTFIGNKYRNLKIGGDIIAIPDETCVSFSSDITPAKVVFCSGAKGTGKTVPPKRWKLPVRIILSTVTLAGAVMAGVFHYRANDYHSQYEKTRDSNKAVTLRDDTKKNRLLGYIGVGISAAGAVGFVITIPLGRKGEK